MYRLHMPHSCSFLRENFPTYLAGAPIILSTTCCLNILWYIKRRFCFHNWQQHYRLFCIFKFSRKGEVATSFQFGSYTSSWSCFVWSYSETKDRALFTFFFLLCKVGVDHFIIHLTYPVTCFCICSFKWSLLLKVNLQIWHKKGLASVCVFKCLVKLLW